MMWLLRKFSWLSLPIQGWQETRIPRRSLGALFFQGFSEVVQRALDGGQLAFEEFA
jgi:hypothetical protein